MKFNSEEGFISKRWVIENIKTEHTDCFVKVISSRYDGENFPEPRIEFSGTIFARDWGKIEKIINSLIAFYNEKWVK